MRIFTICLIACFSMISGSDLLAQDSEITTPEARLIIGIAEMDSEGKLGFSFSPGNAPPVPVQEEVEQTYTVMVPHTEKVEKDGKEVNVTSMRPETKTRTVTVTRMVMRDNFTVEIEKMRFFDINGDELSAEKATDHFEGKQPVVAMFSGGKITDYFGQVFNEDVMIVELPEDFGNSRPGVVRPGMMLPRPLARPRAVPRFRDAPKGKKKDDGKKKDESKMKDDG